MKQFPDVCAYEYSLAHAISRLNEGCTQCFCKECGKQTAVFNNDRHDWDGLCSVCRSWQQGLFSWLLSWWGWELKKRLENNANRGP